MGQGALLIGTLLPKARNFPIAPVGWKNHPTWEEGRRRRMASCRNLLTTKLCVVESKVKECVTLSSVRCYDPHSADVLSPR